MAKRKKSRPATKLTSVKRKAIAKTYKSGLGLEATGKRHKVSMASVSKALKLEKVRPRKRGRPAKAKKARRSKRRR